MPRAKGVRKDIGANKAYKIGSIPELLKVMQYHPIVELVKLAMKPDTEPKVQYWCHKTVCDYVFERTAQKKKVDGDINVLHKMDEKLLLEELPRLIAMESDRIQGRRKHPLIKELEVITVEEDREFELITSEEELKRCGYEAEDNEDGGGERSDLGGSEPVLSTDGG